MSIRSIILCLFSVVFLTFSENVLSTEPFVPKSTIIQSANEFKSKYLYNSVGDVKYLIKFHSLDDIGNPDGKRPRSELLSSYVHQYSDASSIASMDIDGASDFEYFAKIESMASISYLKDNYGIDASIVTSIMDKVVYAYLREEVVSALLEDELIGWVVPDEKVEVSGWLDSDDGRQISNWGVIATNSMYAYGNTPAYMVDIPLPKIPMPDHNIRVNMMNYDRDGFGMGNIFHGVYTSSIIAAINNSRQARGINPGGVIFLSPYNTTIAGMAAALEVAYIHAESLGSFSSFNMSFNHPSYADPTAYANKTIRQLSNRLLISQSAGNNFSNACSHAYVPPGAAVAHPMDGIMVVGAYDRNGDLARHWPDGDKYITTGSNYGPCVDIWAPGKDIAVSTYPNSVNFKNYPKTTIDNNDYYSDDAIESRGFIMAAGGTSYAAPFVTGIAASLSNNNTRPPQIESMLRASAFSTGGGFDPLTGSVIKSVKYSAAPSNSYSKYIKPNIQGIPHDIYREFLTDGRFENGYWNSGGYNAAISFDLSSNNGVTLVRFTPRTSGDGPATYTLRNSQNIQVASGSFSMEDRIPVLIDVPSDASTSWTLNINATSSWVALAELEVYAK